MKDSIRRKLEHLDDRHAEVSALLSEADIITNQNRFRELSQEYAELEPLVTRFRSFRRCEDDIEGAKALLEEDDPEMRAMAQCRCTASMP